MSKQDIHDSIEKAFNRTSQVMASFRQRYSKSLLDALPLSLRYSSDGSPELKGAYGPDNLTVDNAMKITFFKPEIAAVFFDQSAFLSAVDTFFKWGYACAKTDDDRLKDPLLNHIIDQDLSRFMDVSETHHLHRLQFFPFLSKDHAGKSEPACLCLMLNTISSDFEPIFGDVFIAVTRSVNLFDRLLRDDSEFVTLVSSYIKGPHNPAPAKISKTKATRLVSFLDAVSDFFESVDKHTQYIRNERVNAVHGTPEESDDHDDDYDQGPYSGDAPMDILHRELNDGTASLYELWKGLNHLAANRVLDNKASLTRNRPYPLFVREMQLVSAQAILNGIRKHHEKLNQELAQKQRD